MAAKLRVAGWVGGGVALKDHQSEPIRTRLIRFLVNERRLIGENGRPADWTRSSAHALCRPMAEEREPPAGAQGGGGRFFCFTTRGQAVLLMVDGVMKAAYADNQHGACGHLCSSFVR